MQLRILVLLLVLLPTASPASAAGLDDAQVQALLVEIDDRQRNSGDWKARVFIDQKERDRNDVVYDAITYRRDSDDKLMILFVAPRSEKGKGYLRIDKNLWFYDPRIGKWDRRTERERIGGTGSNRNDFDESRLADEYTARWMADEKLGRFTVHRIELKARKGVDVAYPTLQMWIDTNTHNVLKRQDFAASGKLLRTSYTPRWKKVMSPSKGEEVWFPDEMRIYDELEKENRTIIAIRDVDMRELPANIFTKAWLEAKSR